MMLDVNIDCVCDFVVVVVLCQNVMYYIAHHSAQFKLELRFTTFQSYHYYYITIMMMTKQHPRREAGDV